LVYFLTAMPLTLNQFLFLVLTILAVILVTFFVVFIVQLRRTAREGEKTLAEIRELVKNLKLTDHMVKKRIDELGDMMQASRKTVVNLSEATWILTKMFKNFLECGESYSGICCFLLQKSGTL